MSQYELFKEVLRRLDRAGVLQGIVLAGSWCMVMYRSFFGKTYRPSIRTRDVDFLVPRPPKFARKTDVAGLLKDLGFVTDFKGDKGFIRFHHPDLIIEFLAPERGAGSEGPFQVPALGINAQPLRYMDLILGNTVALELDGIHVTVPHPAGFALHKLIVSTRRKSSKAEEDRKQAFQILSLLLTQGGKPLVLELLGSMPPKWARTARRVIREHASPALASRLDV